EQQQQNLLEQNQRQRDELDRSAELPRFTSPEPASPASGPCFTITRITLDGATLLSESQSGRLTAPWINQCLDISRLAELTRAVSDWYIHKGYITSRAFITEQDLSGGELHISVLEG
ncbi:POTRA domain-containing protein, partial [Dryocola boscaweniae]